MSNGNSSGRRVGVKIALYVGLALMVLAILYVADRATGGDVVGGVFGPKQQDPYDEYYEGGFSIGKWKIISPQPKQETLGYAWEYLGGAPTPVTYTRTWYEDGTLESEAVAYNDLGQEVSFLQEIEASTPPSKPSFRKVIMRSWYQDGAIERESVILAGVPSTITEWHLDGSVRLEGQYDSRGERQGPWKFYSPSSSIPSIQTFEHGELVRDGE